LVVVDIWRNPIVSLKRVEMSLIPVERKRDDISFQTEDCVNEWASVVKKNES